MPDTLGINGLIKIVGDHTVINFLENTIDCLFFFNPKVGSNPFLDKGLFGYPICLEGMHNTGKTSVGDHLIDYALRRGEVLNKEVFITKFEINPSRENGDILQLKDQFGHTYKPKQLYEEDKLFLIFQDEITQILKGEENALSGESREAVVLEFCRFMNNEYQNKGNYLFLATTNKYQSLPGSIRNKFHILRWDDAQNTMEKDYSSNTSIKIVRKP